MSIISTICGKEVSDQGTYLSEMRPDFRDPFAKGLAKIKEIPDRDFVRETCKFLNRKTRTWLPSVFRNVGQELDQELEKVEKRLRAVFRRCPKGVWNDVVFPPEARQAGCAVFSNKYPQPEGAGGETIDSLLQRIRKSETPDGDRC